MLYLLYPLVATASLVFRIDSFTTIGVVMVELLIVIRVGIFFYFFHKWALKRFILRRLEKIQKLIEDLE